MAKQIVVPGYIAKRTGIKQQPQQPAPTAPATPAPAPATSAAPAAQGAPKATGQLGALPTPTAAQLATLAQQIAQLLVPGPALQLTASGHRYAPQYKVGTAPAAQPRNVHSWQILLAMLPLGVSQATCKAVLTAGPFGHHCFTGWRYGQGNLATTNQAQSATAQQIAQAIAPILLLRAQHMGNANLLPNAPMPQA